jgi:hypothetical protein
MLSPGGVFEAAQTYTLPKAAAMEKAGEIADRLS